MKQIDFENGGTLNNILATALPMMVAQILNLLYNIVDRIYIARIPDIKKSIFIMFVLNFVYTLLVWLVIRFFPAALIGIFSDDKTILADAIPAFNIYFSTFVFMTFQHCGQVTFKSLGIKNQAIFFSLFRKIIIVVPLTYLLPYMFSRGTDGVFMAEPISNVVGGLACFITMLITVGYMFRTEKNTLHN